MQTDTEPTLEQTVAVWASAVAPVVLFVPLMYFGTTLGGESGRYLAASGTAILFGCSMGAVSGATGFFIYRHPLDLRGAPRVRHRSDHGVMWLLYMVNALIMVVAGLVGVGWVAMLG